jgi:hypothetical protein
MAINLALALSNSLLGMVVIEDRSLAFRTLMSPFSSATYVFSPSGVKARARDPFSREVEVAIEIGLVVRFKEKILLAEGLSSLITMALVASGVMTTNRGKGMLARGLSADGG